MRETEENQKTPRYLACVKGDVVHQDDEQEEEQIYKVHLKVYCVEALEEYSKKAVEEANMSCKYQLN